jgi:hypothetical protein
MSSVPEFKLATWTKPTQKEVTLLKSQKLVQIRTCAESGSSSATIGRSPASCENSRFMSQGRGS